MFLSKSNLHYIIIISKPGLQMDVVQCFLIKRFTRFTLSIRQFSLLFTVKSRQLYWFRPTDVDEWLQKSRMSFLHYLRAHGGWIWILEQNSRKMHRNPLRFKSLIFGKHLFCFVLFSVVINAVVNYFKSILGNCIQKLTGNEATEI